LIQVHNVTKIYKKHVVLKDITVAFSKANIYGLIGVNGSGKTTLLRCICGFISPTNGRVIVNGDIIGKDIDFPKQTGIIIEKPSFLPNYSGIGNLMILAGISKKINQNRVREVMKMVGLDPENKKPVKQYSLGMIQRLGIAQAIMEDPDILILDEPFNGLDQLGIQEMCNLFVSTKKRGKTILLATHNQDEINRICDKVYEIKEGVLNLVVINRTE